ncbi:MAG TPA: hypothetical protein VHV82_11615 [Sporichthyaceae bacterium]|nr:hypothetical protein [Sporichthyaceae bacterium]
MSDHATLPLPDPGVPVRSPQAHARAARRRLRRHQFEWVTLTALVALTAVSREVPPALGPALAVLGIALAVRAWRGAAAERAGLLRSRGPAPTQDMVAAVVWRADPRAEIAEEFRRARNWWAAWTLGALAYLVLQAWLR